MGIEISGLLGLIWLLIIIWAVTAVGSSFLIATLVTQPFATIFLVSVYEQKFGGSRPVRTTA